MNNDNDDIFGPEFSKCSEEDKEKMFIAYCEKMRDDYFESHPYLLPPSRSDIILYWIGTVLNILFFSVMDYRTFSKTHY